MHGSLHRVVRWLRLALACLVLAGAAMPAHALPNARAAAVVALQQRGPVKQRAVADTPREHLPPAPVGNAWLAGPAPFAGRVREALEPSPSRRLFLIHRALLR
jgi:hypothetical protein